jgi:hypothetical protein
VTHLRGDVSAKAHRLLRARAAHDVPHRIGSLYEHLAGVEQILAAWGQPSAIRLAGLMHSVYGTDRFRRAIFAPNERGIVRGAIGAKAERLAWLFCACPREELFTQAGGDDAPLTRDTANLLVLHAANAAEQCCKRDRSPGTWLARMSPHLAKARGSFDITPPVFDECRVIVSTAGERELVAAYDALLHARPGAAGAKLARLRALTEAVPWVGEPALAIGIALLIAGEDAAAVNHGNLAGQTLRQWGCAWDKRLPYAAWLAVAGMLAQRRIVPTQIIDRPNHLAALLTLTARTSRGSAA